MKDNTSQTDKLPGIVHWFGGKGRLCKSISKHLPSGRVYVEPYGGAASMLMRIRPYPVEVYNDLDDRLVNLMRVLQDRAQSRELFRRLKLTLYSRAEFVRALGIMAAPMLNPVDYAWGFFVVQNQGVSVDRCKSPGNWSRVFVSGSGISKNCSTFRRRVALLPAMIQRLRGVQVDNRCALEVIRYWDSPDTVFYVDPPYVYGTRTKGTYVHECDDRHHQELVTLLNNIQGRAMISGYQHPIYDELSDRYRRIEIKTACYAAIRGRKSGLQGKGAALKKVPRTECVWVSS